MTQHRRRFLLLLLATLALVALVVLGVYADRHDIPTQMLHRWIYTPTPTVPPSPTPPPTPTSAPWAPRTLALVAADGIDLAATYYPPKTGAEPAPALLLLHMAYSQRQAWDAFARAAQDAGYALLALDSRGHGASAGEKMFDPTMDRDVDAALAWLLAQPEVDAERVGIAGASVGASLALRGAARHPEVRAVALLSPATRLWALDLREAIVDYGTRALWIAVAEDDTYPAESSRALDAQALGEHRLLLYPGESHGTDMLATHPDLAPTLLAWLSRNL